MRTSRFDLAGITARHCLAATLCALAWLSVLQAAPAAAQTGSAAGHLERSVKAAFLYKFLGYTEFPASAFADATSPIVIGVVGAEDMAAELTRIVAGRTIGTRPIVVRAMKEGDAHTGVHLLFLSASTGPGALRQLKAGQKPLLVVSEIDNGLQQGSVINFRIIDQRVRFDVSLGAAEKHNIKLSSRLLTVAHQVFKEGE